MVSSKEKQKEPTLLVGVWLTGKEEIERFREYQRVSTLKKAGTAGRKLLLERLNEVLPAAQNARA